MRTEREVERKVVEEVKKDGYIELVEPVRVSDSKWLLGVFTVRRLSDGKPHAAPVFVDNGPDWRPESDWRLDR